MLLFSLTSVVLFLEAGVLGVVVFFNASLGNLEEDSPVERVIHWIEAFNELGRRLVAPRDVLLVDLVVLDQVAHEVLDDVPLALLERGLLHEAEDAHVVDHVLHVLLPSQVNASSHILLVG